MFIKLNFLSIATLVLVSIPSFSQSKYRNGAFLELGGNAVAYSLNYERQFSKGFMGRIGMTYLGNSLAFPLTIGKVFGTGKHHFEAQLGIVLANGKTTYFDVNGVKIREERYNYVLATGFIGYRYQKPDKRFFFRLGFTPSITNVYSDDPGRDRSRSFVPWGGTSVGYRF